MDTVSPVEPVVEPKEAVIVVVPAARVEASPCALMVAAVGVKEVQITDPVMSWVEASL